MTSRVNRSPVDASSLITNAEELTTLPSQLDTAIAMKILEELASLKNMVVQKNNTETMETNKSPRSKRKNPELVTHSLITKRVLLPIYVAI